MSLLVAAAASGAILGDNIGYAVGRKFGWRLLARYGPRIGPSRDRLALLRSLFRRHGGALVSFGALVLLRTVGLGADFLGRGAASPTAHRHRPAGTRGPHRG